MNLDKVFVYGTKSGYYDLFKNLNTPGDVKFMNFIKIL